MNNQVKPFGNIDPTEIAQKVVQGLFDQDTLDTSQIDRDFKEKTGKTLAELCIVIAERVANWSRSIEKIEDIAPNTLLIIVIQSVEDIMPLGEELDPVKTIILLMMPELVSGIAYPFLALQSIRIKAVMLAQDSLLNFLPTLADEHVRILMQKYPSALTKASAHAARALERKVATGQGFETDL